MIKKLHISILFLIINSLIFSMHIPTQENPEIAASTNTYRSTHRVMIISTVSYTEALHNHQTATPEERDYTRELLKKAELLNENAKKNFRDAQDSFLKIHASNVARDEVAKTARINFTAHQFDSATSSADEKLSDDSCIVS